MPEKSSRLWFSECIQRQASLPSPLINMHFLKCIQQSLSKFSNQVISFKISVFLNIVLLYWTTSDTSRISEKWFSDISFKIFRFPKILVYKSVK